MKFNIANPSTGLQKVVTVEDEKQLRVFMEKRMNQEVEGEALGPEWKGYVLKISGGNDKQGFPMMQGVMVNHRVRLLLRKGSKCYRPRKTGERKRKSVRGCIVGPDLAVMHLVVVKKGDQDIPGLTDDSKPRCLGPKRAANLRKTFNLTKEDDVRQYVVRREAGKKKKAPKIQRLITPARLQHRRRLKSLTLKKVKAGRAARQEFEARVAKYTAEKKAARLAEVAKKKASALKKKKA